MSAASSRMTCVTVLLQAEAVQHGHKANSRSLEEIYLWYFNVSWSLTSTVRHVKVVGRENVFLITFLIILEWFSADWLEVLPYLNDDHYQWDIQLNFGSNHKRKSHGNTHKNILIKMLSVPNADECSIKRKRLERKCQISLSIFLKKDEGSV